MKKLISVILCLVMLVTMAIPAVAAGTNEKVVNIYLEGYGSALYDENGKQIFGVNLDLVNGIKAIFKDLTLNLTKGMLLGDYDDYCDQLYDLIAPAYAEVKLDKNGEATDDNGNHYYGRGKNPLESFAYTGHWFDGGHYRFDYDWRLSSEYNGELLEQYIDIILQREQADKVNLMGRCLGGNIVSAYLENASETSLKKVNKVVLYIPSTLGVDMISALFSGNIVLDPNAIDNYVKYSLSQNDILGTMGDDTLMQTLSVIVEFINEMYILGFGTDVIEGIVQAVKDNALARILRDSYASFPAFWSMVAPDDIDTAINLIYGTDELKKEYEGTISKALSFRDNVQLNAEKTMKSLTEKGIDIMVISKYNYPNFPLSDNALKQSDSTASTTVTSFGATTSNFGETLDKKYIKSIPEENLRYLSADNMIDASTCLFPEKTWIIKNLYHDIFPQSVNNLMNCFLKSEDMTISTYEQYPQFLKYDDETDTLSPVTGLDEGDIIVRGTVETKLSVFMRFFTILFNFLSKLINGELDLGSLFG